ncbi:MAG: hypothetical protein QOF68_252 [Gaiellales bacterium]|jgi:sarcosine oxidase subunit beta|nr:hypothetical protein [Gaiellales bacterium]
MAVAGVTRGALRSAYEVVIVGGGVQGLALAFELAQRGIRDVCVVDADYPGSGASGRNGEMIRSAFSSVEWAGFFDVSLRRWHALSDALDFNVLFTPAGYLVLASTDEHLERGRRAAARQRELGIPTRIVSEQEVRELAPALNPELIRGGVFQADAGFAHHDAVVWGYARAAARLGVEIHPFTTVTGIAVTAGRVAGVETTRGSISTSLVVDAAGGRSRDVAALAGIEVPTATQRLEAIVTESLRPFLRPAVALVHQLGYGHQTTRGEFVGGTEQRVMPPADNLSCSLFSLRDACQKFVHAFPVLAGARLVRHWAGVIEMAADLAPILGPVPEVEGFWLDSGWVYGFAGAPAAGLLMAEAIDTGRVPHLMAPFAVERLREGRLIAEDSLVVVSDAEAA